MQGDLPRDGRRYAVALEAEVSEKPVGFRNSVSRSGSGVGTDMDSFGVP
jgi:hypothetical protein